MDTQAAFSFFTAAFGFTMGAISLLAFLVNTLHSCLPSNMIKVLESLIEETEACLRKGEEDGLLTDSHFVHQTQERLAKLRSRIWVFRYRVHNTTSPLHDYVEFFRGTSFAIVRECNTVKQLRAEIITCSERERRRLEEASQQVASPVARSIQTDGPSLVSSPVPCLPVLKAWEPGETERASTENVDTQYCASTIYTPVTSRLELESQEL